MSFSEKLSFILELKDADKVSKGLDGIADKAEKSGKAAESSFDKIGSGALKAGAAGLAFAGVMGAALFKAGQSASDVSEAVNKTMVLFGSSGTQMVKWAESADKSMGMSKVAALDAAAAFGNLFRGVGDTAEVAASKSQDFVKLAGDLASFHNANPADVITALGAALRGESEPARQFNILLDDATLKQRAMQMGLGDFTTGTLPQAIKVQAAYKEILEQSKSAAGDFQETSGGLANQQRILKAEMENMKATIGEGVIPVMSKVVGVVGEAFDMFKQLPPEVQKGIGSFLAFGTAGIAAVSAIASIVGAVSKARAALVSLNTSLATASPALLAVGAAVAVAGAALYAYTKDKIEARKRTDEFVKALNDEKAGLKGAEDALIAKSMGDLVDKAEKVGISTREMAQVIKGEAVPAFEGLKKVAKEYEANANSGNAEQDKYRATVHETVRAVEKLQKSHEAATEQIAKKEKADQQAKEAADALGLTEEQLALKTGETSKKQKEAEQAAKDSEKATKERTQAIKDEQKALEDALRAEQARIDAQLSEFNSEIGLRQSHKETEEAVKNLAKAKKEDLGTALDEAATKALTEASAFVRVKDDMAKANGETLTAGQRQDLIVSKLTEVADSLDPGNPLRVRLEEYIGRMNAIPTKVSTLLELRATAAKGFAAMAAIGAGDLIDPTELANAVGAPSYAAGGIVPGQPGEPRLVLAHGQETISQAGMGGAGGPLVVNVVMDGRVLATASYPYFKALEAEHS